jgi:hypothetical protein
MPGDPLEGSPEWQRPWVREFTPAEQWGHIRAASKRFRAMMAALEETTANARMTAAQMDAFAVALDAKNSKPAPMWAHNPAQSKRPTKGRKHRRVK